MNPRIPAENNDAKNWSIFKTLLILTILLTASVALFAFWIALRLGERHSNFSLIQKNTDPKFKLDNTNYCPNYNPKLFNIRTQLGIKNKNKKKMSLATITEFSLFAKLSDGFVEMKKAIWFTLYYGDINSLARSLNSKSDNNVNLINAELTKIEQSVKDALIKNFFKDMKLSEIVNLVFTDLKNLITTWKKEVNSEIEDFQNNFPYALYFENKQEKEEYSEHLKHIKKDIKSMVEKNEQLIQKFEQHIITCVKQAYVETFIPESKKSDSTTQQKGFSDSGTLEDNETNELPDITNSF